MSMVTQYGLNLKKKVTNKQTDTQTHNYSISKIFPVKLWGKNLHAFTDIYVSDVTVKKYLQQFTEYSCGKVSDGTFYYATGRSPTSTTTVSN